MQTALSSRALSDFPSRQHPTRTHRADLNRRFVPVRTSAPPALETLPAILGNHLAVHAFLQRTLPRAPEARDFTASTHRPDYQPEERTIVRRTVDRELVGHFHLQPQVVRFGRAEIPIARLREFAVLPEYARHGLAVRLLAHAERQAHQQGAMLLVARGQDFRLLEQHGWASLGCDPISTVSPQRLLGQLPQVAAPESPFSMQVQPNAEVQIGRLTHLEAMKNLYEQCVGQGHGSLTRSLEYWEWLIKKGSHQRIYLYAEDDVPLAYIVLRGGSVLELMDVTEDRRGSARLLERTGADAIEQGRHTLRVYAPYADTAHRWCDAGGGKVFIGPEEESWMVKVLSVRTLLRRLATEYHRRVRHEQQPIELTLQIGSESLVLKQGVRSVRVTRGATEDVIGLTCRAATQLLLGYRDVKTLAEAGTLTFSSAAARKQAEALFPPVELWRTKWDEMPIAVR